MTLTDMVRRGDAVRDVDLWAGLGALTWSVVALLAGEVPDLAPFRVLGGLVSPHAASAFAVVALGRWYSRWSKRT